MTVTNKHERITDDFQNKISYVFGFVLIIALLGLYGIVFAIDQALPTPLMISDEKDNRDSFIAERARNYLKPLTDLGPKVTGSSANEIEAVNYLLRQIEAIKSAANTAQEIEVDLQVVSGSYFLDYKPYGAINAYANVQNVVVKIHSGSQSNHSVLLNVHFDTVPTSPGGSDDGINVAVALEVLKKMSGASVRPKNNVVFLFNGAEEATLLASHGFIRHHKWAAEVTVLVNLEATGGGGKEILFQTGPDRAWLMNHYSVPHPHGNVAGEELFQSNIIPSDTDFRIFRDFGDVIGNKLSIQEIRTFTVVTSSIDMGLMHRLHSSDLGQVVFCITDMIQIYGYDMAFTRDGYRYHTKFDGFDNIEFGRFQHTGDNVLRLMRNLADASEVSNPKPDDGDEDGNGTVFFDFIGLFFVNYTTKVSIIVNVITIIVSALVTLWCLFDFQLGTTRSALYFAFALFSTLLGWIVAGCFVLLVGVVLDAAYSSMSWYGKPPFIFGLYCASIATSLCLATMTLNNFAKNIKLSLSRKIMIHVHATRIIWTVVVLVGTCSGIRSSFVFLVPVLFNTVAVLLIQGFKLYESNKIWPIVYLLSTILPTMLIMYMGHEVVALFIPICGRFGSGTNPEFIIAMLLLLATVLIVSYYVPLLIVIDKPWYIILGLSALFLSAFILALTPFGFPFNGDPDHPKFQRFTIYHSRRIFRDDSNNVIKDDAGFFFANSDRASPHSIEDEVRSMKKATSISEDCEAAPVCGMPVTNSRNLNTLQDSSTWIPAVAPVFGVIPSYNYVREELSANTIRYRFTIRGSDRMDVFISPRNGSKLLSMDLVEELPKEQSLWKGQPVYYVYFAYGKEPAPLGFTFVIEVPDGWDKPTLDVAVSAKYIHEENHIKTEEYRQFLDEFPEWTVITNAAVAYYESFVLR